MSDLCKFVGSLLVCGFDGLSLPDKFRQLLSQNQLGGIILFARNYDGFEKLQELTSEANRAASTVPLIAVDQEGGRVVRFSKDFPVFPSPGYYHQQCDAKGLIFAAETSARKLKEAGVNLNLIPVCDLAPDDTAHVIHSRSYSQNPEEVASIASNMIDSLKKSGVLTCAKHFPGLGSSYGDPHFEVSRSDQSLRSFRSRDYVPFKSAIASGVDMIMVTHLIAPAIDPTTTSTFSRKTIVEELRGHLKYDGLVISDDLLMAGALEKITPVKAGVKAINAGCNLLIYGNLSENLDSLILEVATLAESDRELAENIRESYHRVMNFKREKSELMSHELQST